MMLISLVLGQMNHSEIERDMRSKTAQEVLCVFDSMLLKCALLCYKPSSALVQAQPLERSLII